MSTFEEENRSIEQARQFLYDLLDPKKTPKVPKEIRLRARQVVKHYPILMVRWVRVLDVFVEKFKEDKKTRHYLNARKDGSPSPTKKKMKQKENYEKDCDVH